MPYKNPEDAKNWIRERHNYNRVFIERVRRRAKCAKCGLDDKRVLVFHHRDSSNKKFSIGTAIGNVTSTESIKEEMRKCDILCRNCHAIEHYTRRL